MAIRCFASGSHPNKVACSPSAPLCTSRQPPIQIHASALESNLLVNSLGLHKEREAAKRRSKHPLSILFKDREAATYTRILFKNGGECSAVKTERLRHAGPRKWNCATNSGLARKNVCRCTLSRGSEQPARLGVGTHQQHRQGPKHHHKITRPHTPPRVSFTRAECTSYRQAIAETQTQTPLPSLALSLDNSLPFPFPGSSPVTGTMCRPIQQVSPTSLQQPAAQQHLPPASVLRQSPGQGQQQQQQQPEEAVQRRGRQREQQQQQQQRGVVLRQGELVGRAVVSHLFLCISVRSSLNPKP
jgi:hypothetical protein